MTTIVGTRFGTLEVEEPSMIHLPAGLIGFPAETRFALLRFGHTRLAYMQSMTSPHLALTVIDAAIFGAGYPEPSAASLAAEADLGPAVDLAVLVPVAQRAGTDRLFANLLAPIVIDASTRRGSQVVLDPRRYSTATELPTADSPSDAPSR